MIPKIAHYHWTGGPMSWLRVAGIASFKRHNPTWEIRIHDTPEDIRKYGLQYAQEADWTWWRALKADGGFLVASDIIFIRPVPEMWMRYDLCGCVNDRRVMVHNAMIGATAGHPFVMDIEAECASIARRCGNPGYQDFGPNLLSRKQVRAPWSFCSQSMEALCHFRHDNVEPLWADWKYDFPPEVVGVHWYGGHPMSKAKEPFSIPSSRSLLERTAQAVFDDPVCNPHGKEKADG